MPDPAWPDSFALGTQFPPFGEVAAIGIRGGERFVMLVNDGVVSLIPPSSLHPEVEDRPGA